MRGPNNSARQGARCRQAAHRSAGGRGAAHRGPPHARPPHRARRRRAGGQRRGAQCDEGRGNSPVVVPLAGHNSRVECVATAPDSASSPARGAPSRYGATARAAHHPGAQCWVAAVAVLRAERASSASRTTAPRAVDARRRSRAHLRGGQLGVLRRGLPDGVHFVIGLGFPSGESGCTSRWDARPRLQGAHLLRCHGGGDARRSARHQRLD